MNIILPHIQEWFLPKEEHFIAFAKADSRVESWFKAELFVLFNRLMRSGHLCGFEREAGIGPLGGGRPKKVDFRLDIQGEKHLCELKAPCISQTKTKRNLRFYFRDNAGGIFRDFKKLDDLPGRNKWVLGFVYPAPEFSEWSDAIASVPDSLRHWQLTTRPQDYPKYLFLALWRDTRIAQ